MRQTKRKSRKEFSQEDSFKQNRSSLNVNLSCISNLSDSGNGSLKTMELVGHDTLADSMRFTRFTRSRSRLKTASKNNSYLKDVSVVLEDISRADQSLNIRSKKLTDAILNKTRQIFHKENELSRRTSMVLENIASAVLGSDIEHNSEAPSQKSIPNIVSNNHGNSCQTDKNQLFHDICTTPKKQQVSKQCDVQQKGLVHEQEKYFTSNVLRQDHGDIRNNTISASPVSHKRSPILSQSRRKLNTSKFLLPKPKKLNTKNELEPFQSRYLPNHQRQLTQSPTSSALSDESMLGAFPVACSSMIEECTNRSKQYADVETNNLHLHSDIHTRKSLLSMEVTDVRGGFIVEKLNLLQYQSNSSTNTPITCKSRETNIATENNLVVAKKLSIPIMQKSKNKYSMKRQEVNTNDLSWAAQVNPDNVEESVNSIRSSLNVNTSNDILTENDNAYRKSKETRSIQEGQTNSVPQAVNDSCQIISEEEQESAGTVHTSLQMNTSLKGPYRSFMKDNTKQSHHSKNSIEGSALHDTSNTSTVQIYNKENSGNITRNNENMTKKQPETEDQNITVRNKSKSTVNENVGGKSYIEPTPYPPPRSMMWRSLARQTTEMQSLQNDNIETTNHSTNTKKSGLQDYRFNTIHKDTIMSQIERNIVDSITRNTTIFLDDSDVAGQPPRKFQHSVIVADSDTEVSQDSQLSETKDRDGTSIGPKTHRKKLLPIRENSGLLSFSPIEESDLDPPQNIFPRTRKKIKKKDTKRKPKNVTFHDPSNKESQKEPKRTRRIQSKKITIKKLTNVDILKTLERERREPDTNLNSTGYNTASPSDFENKKYISTAKLTKGLARKVVIVTTGLSKEDKSLVKSVIKSIGKAKMELSVSPQTTYVVTTGVRTLNLLHGIIRGCWLVTMEWVLKSLEHKQWLNPVEYEIAHFSKAVTANRKERMQAEQYGVSHVPDLFAATGFIYVENGGTSPPSSALKDLIKAGGGQITEIEHTAKIIIGSTGLKESWILDCITTGELQPYAQYKRN